MIVSASYRTDVPAFFSGWFRDRLKAGFCDVANPYGGRPYRVGLGPDEAEGFVFWTRNAAPFRSVLSDLGEERRPFVVQFTVTGYPRALDAHTPRADEAVAQILRLSADFGPRAVVWRYDPVVFSGPTEAGWHAETFARLALSLRGAVDECVVSVMHPYAKTARRLHAAAKAAGFSWRDPDIAEKRALLARLSEIAGNEGMRLTLCSQPALVGPDIPGASCIDAARLSDVAGYEIRARQKGNRPGCLCAESRDIGAYDSCAHGCVYCYAVSDHAKAAEKARSGAPDGRAGAP
jgi:hypothetical protein